MINDKKVIYLAGPYSSDDPKILTKRWKMYNKISSTLISNKDVYVFSPITYSHPIVHQKNFNKDFWTYEYWMPFDKHMLAVCDEMWIVDIEGWDKSKGVLDEIEFAKANNIKIKMVTPRGRTYKYEG